MRGILLVEDDGGHAQLALRALERCEGLRVEVVESVSQAREALARNHVDLVLADLRLPDGSGLDLLDQPTPVVVQTSQGDETRAVAAMKGGALDYCVKSPEMYRDLPIIIERALNASRNLFERRRVECSLRESDERFRQLAASIPEVFWLFDLGTRQVVYASPAWEAVYGQVPRTWEGRLLHGHPDDVVSSWSPTATDADVFRIVEGSSVRWVEERRFWITDAAGEPHRLSCLAVDISRRRELEESLRHSQKMHAIGRLAGGVAHDFNNMLVAILSSAHELAETGADPELCELIISASERASDLTRNLLAFSRRGRMEKTVVDVHKTMQEAIALLGRGLESGVRITKSLDAESSEVLGDAAQLQSAFLNLGINARHALVQGGEIHFSSREVVIDETSSPVPGYELAPGRYLEISVRDTGAGIPEETLPRIFEPFFTTKDRDRGTGLGLAAVYGTMLDHRGAVTVQSKVGEGTLFTLLFPLASLGSAPETVAPQALAHGQGLVLLVDDEQLVLDAVRRMIERLGYQVRTASDGDEGWRIFQEQKSEFVAVVSDVSMPKLGGRELVQRILRLSPDFPCILCTGYASASEADFPVPLLSKPFARAELAQALSSAISTGGTIQ